MEGEASAAARAFYARLGLAATALPADFLGTLLECAAWLAETPDGAALEETLFRDHLAPWVGRFARDLAKHSALLLYRALGERLAALFPAQDDD
jgi:TorA maturation chaperone TorD